MAEEYQPLSHAILKDCLRDIEIIVGGGGFAFTRLDCSNKEITDLGNKVCDYKQLKHIVLSQNKIQDLSEVMKLPHLLTLQADENQVNKLDCAAESELPWCQRLDLSKNKLTRLPSLLPFERLRFAKFAENEIASLEGFGDHPVLEVLELQGNQLTSLVGMGCLKNLRLLNIESNELTSLEGLNTPSLATLNLGSNALETLAFIDGASECRELILTGCKLSGDDIQMPELKRLAKDTPNLAKITLSGNPLFEALGENLKAEVVARIPQVTTVEGEEVLDEDREAAVTRAEELVILKKEADEQAAREEAERLAAEAEAKAAEEAEKAGE
jgi:Leucine-rich repeat (LRR) protein